MVRIWQGTRRSLFSFSRWGDSVKIYLIESSWQDLLIFCRIVFLELYLPAMPSNTWVLLATETDGFNSLT
jgi:hypothetical protein